MLCRFDSGWATGTTGLSINSLYVTNDITSTGHHVVIDGRGYLSTAGKKAIIQRSRTADALRVIAISVHELGHSLFSFPDMDHGGGAYYTHYALGNFCSMSQGIGFGGRPSPYNPRFRIQQGWLTDTTLSNGSNIFTDLQTTRLIYKYDLPNYTTATVQNQKFYFTYHMPSINNYWEGEWPIPRDALNNKRGLMIWHNNPSGQYSNVYRMPNDIIAAHGKWQWDLSNAVLDSNNVPLTVAVNLGIEDPLKGRDSLETRFSYIRFQWTPSIYDWAAIPAYPDYRIGSATCFYNPASPKTLAFYTNPNSNGALNNNSENYSRSVSSDIKMTNLRMENGVVKADFIFGAAANILSQNTNLRNGIWYFDQDITINSGVTFTLEPGVILNLENNSKIIVNGSLVLNGTNLSLDQSKLQINSGGNIILQNNAVLNFTSGNLVIPTSGSIQLGNNCTCNFSPGCDLIINGSLTMQNYSRINFTSSATDEGTLQLYGALNINGAQGQEVILDFGSPNLEMKGFIFLHENSVANINYAKIRNTGYALYAEKANLTMSRCEITTGKYGLYFRMMNPIVRYTRVSGFLWDVILWTSSPKFNNCTFENAVDLFGAWFQSRPYCGGSESFGNNIFRYGTRGVYSQSSFPEFGRTPFDGHNSIYSNSGSNFTAMSNSVAYARFNWWGAYPPDMSKIIKDATSTLDISNYLPGDPNPPSMQPAQGNENNSNNTTSNSDLLAMIDEAISLSGTGNYSGAISICKNVIDNYPQADEAPYALSIMYESCKQSNIDEFINYVEMLYNKKEKATVYAIAGMHLSNYKDGEKLKILDKVIKKYEGDDVVDLALGDKFHHIFFTETNMDKKNKDLHDIVKEMDKLFKDSKTTKLLHSLLDDDLNSGNSASKSNAEIESMSDEQIPSDYELIGNYPNPFNPSTSIEYALPVNSSVEIKIYDITGKLVKEFTIGNQSAGYHNVVWNSENNDGEKVSSGVYLYTIKAASLDGGGKNFIKSGKMMLLK